MSSSVVRWCGGPSAYGEAVAGPVGRTSSATPRRTSMPEIVGVTVVCMAVERFSVTMDPEVGAAVREAAEQAGTSVSAWLAEAAADKIRRQRLRAALDVWEIEDGALTPDELAAAATTLESPGEDRSAGSAA